MLGPVSTSPPAPPGPAGPAATGTDELPPRHSLLEDAAALLTGAFLVAWGVVLLASVRGASGGVAGVAFLLSYVTPVPLGVALRRHEHRPAAGGTGARPGQGRLPAHDAVAQTAPCRVWSPQGRGT